MPAVSASFKFIVVEADSRTHFQCMWIGFVGTMHSEFILLIRNITFHKNPGTNVLGNRFIRIPKWFCLIVANVISNKCLKIFPQPKSYTINNHWQTQLLQSNRTQESLPHICLYCLFEDSFLRSLFHLLHNETKQQFIILLILPQLFLFKFRFIPLLGCILNFLSNVLTASHSEHLTEKSADSNVDDGDDWREIGFGLEWNFVFYTLPTSSFFICLLVLLSAWAHQNDAWQRNPTLIEAPRPRSHT